MDPNASKSWWAVSSCRVGKKCCVYRCDADGVPAFVETVEIVDWSKGAAGWECARGTMALIEEHDKADYAACVLGLRDYIEKNRFPGVVLGLSGGIDSALCAAMAVDAIGADRVHAVMLPFRFTSSESFEDAAACAKALGIRYDTLPIAEAVEGFEALLKPVFEGRARDITEENLQSRARGTILMAISNKFGPMVVTTGNKSEMSVGYATLYGDMNGGYNPIKDLYKTRVFETCRWRNANHSDWMKGQAGAVIPDGSLVIGSPGKVVRENDEQTRQFLLGSAAHYVEKGLKMVTDLVEVKR